MNIKVNGKPVDNIYGLSLDDLFELSKSLQIVGLDLSDVKDLVEKKEAIVLGGMKLERDGLQAEINSIREALRGLV